MIAHTRARARDWNNDQQGSMNEYSGWRTSYADLKRYTQQAHDAIITSSWRQNDVVTSFLRHNDVIFAPCVDWDRSEIQCWIDQRENIY